MTVEMLLDAATLTASHLGLDAEVVMIMEDKQHNTVNVVASPVPGVNPEAIQHMEPEAVKKLVRQMIQNKEAKAESKWKKQLIWTIVAILIEFITLTAYIIISKGGFLMNDTAYWIVWAIIIIAGIVTLIRCRRK